MATKIRRAAPGQYTVHKLGECVATIQRVAKTSDWTGEDHWALQHVSGRVDRHQYFHSARDDALKI